MVKSISVALFLARPSPQEETRFEVPECVHRLSTVSGQAKPASQPADTTARRREMILEDETLSLEWRVGDEEEKEEEPRKKRRVSR